MSCRLVGSQNPNWKGGPNREGAVDPERALPRVMEHVSPEPNTGCWLWMGCINKGGYGRTYFGLRAKLAHRVTYNLLRGEIPPGLELDHKCRVRCCVNPDHLEPVTRKENVRRGVGVGAAWVQAARLRALSVTHCPSGHPYDELAAPGRRRKCGECNRLNAKRWKLSVKGARAYVGCMTCNWRGLRSRSKGFLYACPCCHGQVRERGEYTTERRAEAAKLWRSNQRKWQ